MWPIKPDLSRIPYEIALSFAGEDRTYVEMVARFLQSHDVPLFYDDYSDVDLWGKDLYTHLIEVYSQAERYVVMFISRHYAERFGRTMRDAQRNRGH